MVKYNKQTGVFINKLKVSKVVVKMAIQSEMTVSVSKGKTTETSTAHNNRKTNLKDAPEEKVKAFYDQAGHKHIHKEYTDLNEDMIKDPLEMYDKLFEKSILEYNQKQKRKDRKIGKGLALTVKEKQEKVVLLTMVHKYKQIKSKKKQQEFLEDLTKTQPEMAKSVKSVLPNFDNLSLRDTHELLTQAKHAKTLGEALYDKQKRSKQSSTHVEFIFQIGSAEDFNEMDKNGRIVKSYDRRDPNGIWQKSKRVLKRFEKQFEKENPALAVVNWSIHMDESTPHAHVEVIPVAETAKTTARGKADKNGKFKRNGLTVKPSFDGALESMGFKKDPRDSRKAFKKWQNREAESLAKIMQNELGVTRRKGYTNRLKDVHEYKKVKEDIVKQREKAQNYKTIADENAVLANHNYDVYQKNAKAVKKAQVKLSNLTTSISEAQKTLSEVSKEKQRRLDALTQEIAQKRSEKLRELSKELKEKRQKEEAKLQAREDAVSKREVNVKNRQTDLDAIQFGGIDSKGKKHKSINQRIKEGIENGIRKVQKTLFHPIKAFTYAYRKSMVEQQHPNYTKEQVKKLTDIQETYLESQAGGSKARILQELASDRYEHKSIKAISAGAKALAKELPSYQMVDEAITDAILLDQLENEEKQHKQEQKLQDQPKQTPTVSKDKDEDSPDFFEDF